MTEMKGDRSGERLDLRALDLTHRREIEDATIHAVLARITARSRPPDWMIWMPRLQRGLAAAAVVFALLAGGIILSRRDTNTRDDVTALLEQWVARGQVPTNGELLAAYRGYRP